jgi:hypothetical protein
MPAMICREVVANGLRPRSIANRDPVSIPRLEYESAHADSTVTEEDVACG